MDKSLIKNKVENLIEGWCDKDLKISAKRYLDLLDTNEEEKERINFINNLSNSICTIDELEEFASSDHGLEVIGKERINDFRKHVKNLKDNGALYCDCDACKKALEILNILKSI